MGGSPCNDLSGINPYRRGLLDPEGSGILFFEYVRCLNVARLSADPERPFFWMFENVLSMKLIERARISRHLRCNPIVADAKHVSAAARPRLFWGNIPGIRTLKLRPNPKNRLTVQSCLEPGLGRTATLEKLSTITSKKSSLTKSNSGDAPVLHKGEEDTLWSTEVERVFGVPQHYTDVNNLSPKERLSLLGRSWSVPVLQQMFAPLQHYFKMKEESKRDRVSNAYI